MTELIKLMKQRQSCRHYSDKPVEAEKIVSCINAACLAPSACNTQPYHFYVAHAPEAVAVAAEYCKGEKVNKWVSEAKAFVIITQEHAEIPAANSEARKRDFRQYDIGLAIENFCLEATELGLGTCILGVFNEEKLKASFRIPSHKSIALVIAMGYPADEQREKKRKPLEEVITYLR
ncbi:MAG: nitroreductase family protein [Oscillospiraceae bacterium]|nr:nitroreductase family protein [Oscillospiraceae bacterium]